jgi:WD40 repeat protein
MATEIETPLEPYIGPVPFETKDAALFFGRDSEADELLSLAVAHPVVLMYAQSGAGKTSLLNANLIPKLRKEGYDILPVARVQGTECDSRTNIYVFNTLMSWSDGTLTGSQLLKTSLRDFLDGRAHQKNDVNWELPRFLIFDQFEELFTAYPHRWQERKDFFIQIRDALEADYLLRVIFAMREDYIAELDAYASLLPEKLRTRFRLGRPREKAALAAITKPLQVVKTKRRFDHGVAEQLVHNLMMIPADGDGEPTVGEYVEPVQLQVVCQSLWRNLLPQDEVITFQHLEHCGDVNRALGAFYEQCLAEVITKTSVRESQLRNWFGNTLITLDGTRGMAFRGPEFTDEMPNSAVDVLQKLHLIKEEKRGKSRWYELAHDRFIDPIRKSNETWWGARAGAVETTQRLERRAKEWVRSGRGEEELLDEAELLEVDRWLDSPDATELAPSDSVLALISASRAAVRDRAEGVRQAQMLAVEQARRLRQQRIGLVFLSLLLIGMVMLTGYAFRQRAIARGALIEAERQRSAAMTQRDIADANKAEADRLRNVAEASQATAIDQKAKAEVDRDAARKAEKEAVDQKALAETAKVLAETARADAENQKIAAQSRDLAAAANSYLRTDPELSVVLAREAVNRTYQSNRTAARPAAEALHSALLAFRQKVTLQFAGDPPEPTRGAFSPDGSRFAGTGSDGNIKVWDVNAGTVRTFSDRTKPTPYFAFFDNGKTLLSLASDRSFLLWDVESGSVLDRTPTFSQLDQLRITVNDNCGIVAYGWETENLEGRHTRKRKTFAWNVSSRRFDRLPVPENALEGIDAKLRIDQAALSPNGEILAIGGAQGSSETMIVFVDLVRGGYSEKLRAMKFIGRSAVALIAFSSDGKRVAAAGWRGAVKVWEPVSGDQIFESCDPTPSEEPLAFTRDLEYIATAGTGNTAKIRRLREPVVFHSESKTEVRPEVLAFVGHNSSIARAVFTTNGRLITVGNDKSVIAWEASSGREVATLSGSWVSETAGLAFSPDGKRLAVAVADNSHPMVEIWEGTNNVLTLKGHVSKVWGVTYDREGQRIATSSSDETVKIWNANTGQVLKSITVGCDVREVAFSPSGERVATACAHGGPGAAIWDVESTRQIRVLTGHTGDVWGVSYSPDGKRLATSGSDKTARVWDAETGRELFTLLHDDVVWKVAFSPDGKKIATASHDGTAKVWNSATGELLLTLMVRDQLWGVSFSSDGKRIATASTDMSARIWDAETGKLLLVLTGHVAPVNRAVFSPDGRYLATSSEDRTVRLYTFDIAELIALSLQRVPRSLTDDERREYLPER